MSAAIRASADGTQAIIQVGGVDRATVDNTGKLTVAKVEQSTAQSMVRLHTANGYGSTNTKIRRFTTTVTNQGTDITYADSATLGASFTINASGVYSISYTFEPNAANNQGGVSLNTSSPTTSIFATPVAEILTATQAYSIGAVSSMAWTGYLASGAVVRAHDDGAAAFAGGMYLFTITRVA